MKCLIIGGTGTISRDVVKELVKRGDEVFVLNRGTRPDLIPEGANSIVADIFDIHNVSNLLTGKHFDFVCDFIAFTKEDVERDFELFNGMCDQFIFISSASTYHKPATDFIITEGTAQSNPYSLYARNKIACELYLMDKFRQEGFPVTIVRPSHTYDDRKIPVGVHGDGGFWPVVKRMIDGKPVIVHGDGSSLWTLTHSRDFAVGFAGIAGNFRAVGEVYQIIGDDVLTWDNIHRTIAKVYGVEADLFHVSSEMLAKEGANKYDFEGALIGDKAVSVIFDNSKIKRIAPKFTTTIRFEEGVRIAKAFLDKHPEEMEVTDPQFDEFCDRLIQKYT